MYYIYRITNIINGKIYIGQTIQPNIRWSNHKSVTKRKPTQCIHHAMKKYGVENFIFEVILTCKTQTDANEVEDVVITQYDSRNNDLGYNIARGGSSNSGPAHHCYGKKLTQEHKNKIGISQLGKIMSNESKEKIRKSLTGVKRSAECCRNISLGLVGKPSGKKGKKSSIFGSNVSTSKLTEDIVIKLRAEYASGEYTYKELAEKYKVHIDTIFKIITYKLWKHI